VAGWGVTLPNVLERSGGRWSKGAIARALTLNLALTGLIPLQPQTYNPRPRASLRSALGYDRAPLQGSKPQD